MTTEKLCRWGILGAANIARRTGIRFAMPKTPRWWPSPAAASLGRRSTSASANWWLRIRKCRGLHL